MILMIHLSPPTLDSGSYLGNSSDFLLDQWVMQF